MLQRLSQINIIAIVLLLTACAQLPTNFEAKPSYIITDTQDTQLGRKSKETLGEKPKQSKMLLIADGVGAFVARASLLLAAEKTIDVQYYIWHSDLVGKLLFNELITAADRGVRVRILLDDMPLNKETESILYALDQHRRIEVRLFNPFATRGFRATSYLMQPGRINRRMHNKSFTVDNQFTIIGGRNIGDEYFSAHKVTNFKDLDVLATGPVVAKVGMQFDLYWNSKVVYPVTAFDHNTATQGNLALVRNELNEFAIKKENSKYHLDIKDSVIYQSIIHGGLPANKQRLVFQGEVEVVYDDPLKALGKTEDEVSYLKSLVEPYIESISKSFEIISPYFVPGEKGVEYLTQMVERGIKVRVLTNSLSSTDGLMAQSGYSRRRYDLLKGGVEVYEIKTDVKTKSSKSLRRGEKAKSALHTKTYIFDRQEVFIGSFNFDLRSSNINSEVGVIYVVPDMAKLISEAVFVKNINDVAYSVKIATDKIETDTVKIEKGDVYWLEKKDGKLIYYDSEPETGFWRRFGQGFFSILPIESQL
jgi:cardiolipin synthase C